jgi:hypothetical protein
MKMPKQVKDRRKSLKLPKQVKEVKRDVKNVAAGASMAQPAAAAVAPSSTPMWL